MRVEWGVGKMGRGEEGEEESREERKDEKSKEDGRVRKSLMTESRWR